MPPARNNPPPNQPASQLRKEHLVYIVEDLEIADNLGRRTVTDLRSAIRIHFENNPELLEDPRYTHLFPNMRREHHIQEERPPSPLGQTPRPPSIGAPRHRTPPFIEDFRPRTPPPPSIGGRSRAPSLAVRIPQQRTPSVASHLLLRRALSQQVSQLGPLILLDPFEGNQFQINSISSPSTNKKGHPPIIPGLQAEATPFHIPEPIRRKFKNGGWMTHIPLSFLIDHHCIAGKTPEALENSMSIDKMTGEIIHVERSLLSEEEYNISFDSRHSYALETSL